MSMMSNAYLDQMLGFASKPSSALWMFGCLYASVGSVRCLTKDTAMAMKVWPSALSSTSHSSSACSVAAM